MELGVTQSALDESELAAFRRFYYESHTSVLGDLRLRLEGKDNDEPRRFPMAEKAQRLEEVRGALNGTSSLSLLTGWWVRWCNRLKRTALSSFL